MTEPPFDQRRSGILLHPTSLPGPHGSGDLGPAAHRFAEFLRRSGQGWWQMLPVGPTGGGNSPYDSPSSFAGNPMLVSLELLAEDGLLRPEELSAPRRLERAQACLFGASRRFRMARLRRAFERFSARPQTALRHELEAFRERSRFWLEDYSAYAALREARGDQLWTAWEPDLTSRRKDAVAEATGAIQQDVLFQEFVQFLFDRQWHRLRRHCNELGVLLLGDVPMFVAHDSADAWAKRQFFQLDARGHRLALAGVPPDYFSQDGQLWGNPLYDWEALRRDGYHWWIERLRMLLARFDGARIDHFIGLVRCWAVPPGAPNAREGQFQAVPGVELLERLRQALGGLPFIAEDLGLVTPEVHALRDRFELPGMRILQFAFDDNFRDYQPHRHPPGSVVYTGTHDNDTLVGWLTSHERATSEQDRSRCLRARTRALAYAGNDGSEPHWSMIRLAYSSPANTALFPIQDIFGLGTRARMNVPGTPVGNWTFRVQEQCLTTDIAERLWKLGESFERIPSTSTP